MMKRTHIAIGVAAGITIINYFNLPFIGIVSCYFGSVAPDWDFRLGIKHRTWTHSLLLLAVSTYLIYLFNLNSALLWFSAYLLHLIADSLTKTGVPFLYPFIKNNYGFKLFTTGKSEDLFILLIFIWIISELIK